MAKHMVVLGTALVVVTATSWGLEPVKEQNLVFGSVIDSECDEVSYLQESVALGAWATQYAIKTVVGYGSSLLQQATKTKNETWGSTAPGALYYWEPIDDAGAWKPSEQCIRFWYGKIQSSPVPNDAVVDYGKVPIEIDRRWRRLGMIEQPYLYSEIRLVGRASENAAYLNPVVVFARRTPEAQGWFRKSTNFSVAVDLHEMGAEKPFASYTMNLPDVNSGAVLLHKTATRGIASSWAVLPAPPNRRTNHDEDETAGLFQAKIVAVSDSDGTVLGKTISTTFEQEKDSFIASLMPIDKAQANAARRTAIAASYDALVRVEEAKAALDAATDAGEKSTLAIKLHKEMFLADQQLIEAGRSPRFNVSGP